MERTVCLAILFFIGFAVCAAEPSFPAEVVFSDGKKVGEKSWNGIGTISLTYSSAKKRLDLELRKQGWSLIRNIEYDRIHWKSLEVWGRGKEKILLQYWREDVDLTGFSWGFLKDEKKS